MSSGTGMMGCEHLQNLLALPGATVRAVSDPDAGSRVAAAALVDPDVAILENHRDLLAVGDIDAVIVASPNHTHRAVLDDLWAGGWHLFIEKPLCTTTEDCLEVRRRATDHEGLVWVGLEYRYMPAVARLLQQVRAGDTGRVHMVSIREHRFPFLTKVGDWNRFSRNTGGTLVEKCCHFFDLMNLTLGERPNRVFASGAQDVNHLDERYDGETPDILDNAYVIVDYPSGARALLDLCMFAEGSRWEQELTVVGDVGKLEANLPGFMEVSRGRAGGAGHRQPGARVAGVGPVRRRRPRGPPPGWAPRRQLPRARPLLRRDPVRGPGGGERRRRALVGGDGRRRPPFDRRGTTRRTGRARAQLTRSQTIGPLPVAGQGETPCDQFATSGPWSRWGSTSCPNRRHSSRCG